MSALSWFLAGFAVTAVPSLPVWVLLAIEYYPFTPRVKYSVYDKVIDRFIYAAGTAT